MGEEAWEEAWRKGRGMTLDEAVSYAMEKVGPKQLISFSSTCELQRIYRMRTLDTTSSFRLGVRVVSSTCHLIHIG